MEYPPPPHASAFHRVLTPDLQIQSTCKQCGCVMTGDIDTDHSDHEWNHLQQCMIRRSRAGRN